MKSIFRKLTLCALLGVAGNAHALNVKVDSNQTWLGYMNVFNLPANGGAFQFGGTWGTADLVAVFNSGSLTLSPNTIGDPDPYWYTPAGGPGSTGNKIMEANFYVELGAPTGETVNFSGNVTGFSFTSAHTTKAFIKDFAPDYSSFNVSEVVISQTGAFNISLPTSNDPARHLQYGFQTVGPNVWITDVAPFGTVVIQDEPAPFVPDQIPNGDFETINGASWATTQPGATGPFFPTSGGNGIPADGGNAVLDGTGAFAVLYAFNNTEKTFASLGLAPGDTYTVQMDMKITNGGTNIGGLRLDGPGGFSPEFYPAIIGDGSAWATYSIELTVPGSPASAKFGLRPGAGSIVAFDNVKIILPGPPPPVVASIKQGTVVGWTVNDPDYTYQPQKRDAVEDEWSNIGSPVPGTSVPYAFEETASNFYQVLETTPGAPENGVLNPGFENLVTIEEVTFAENWTVLAAADGGTATIAANYPGGYTPHSGTKMLVLESVTGPGPIVPAPNLTVSCDNFAVAANTSYDLSFWAAHVEKTGGANPQFLLEFFGDFGFIGNQINSFASVGNTWTKVQKTFTTPAGAVAMRILLIQAVGADPSSNWVTLLDDFELIIPGEGSVNENEATAGPGVEVSWNTNDGKTYQVRTSGNLVDWSNFGSPVVGDGSVFSVADPITPPGVKFYRVGETP
jgi:uncharacterized protein YaiE (UPF0345 family)